MIVLLEAKKLRHTGYFPAFLGGTALAAAIPPIHMSVRSDTFTAQPGDPFRILTDANWQLMTMLNLFLVNCCTCMMYYTDFADNGAQKMETLPVTESRLFCAKLLLFLSCIAVMLLLETIVLALCGKYWFADYEKRLSALLKTCGFSFAAALPTVILMLLFASVCKNMWVSLGIGVLFMFTCSMFPKDSLFFSLCPFNSPYLTFAELADAETQRRFLSACAAESVLFLAVKLLMIKLRRCFS